MAMSASGNSLAGEQRVVAAGFPATLIEPAGGSDTPVVLFFSGSGPTDRDGNSRLGVTASYLAKLAANLAELGIGSLRFDKRGIPGSIAVEREEAMTITTYADDGTAVFDWLSSHAAARPIVLLGHSEGGLVALSVARMRPNAAGIVLLAAPGRPLADILRGQLLALEEPLRTQALDIMGRIEDGETVEDMPASLSPLFRPSIQPFLQSLFARRPAEELAQIGVPALVIGGGRDLQVAREDFEALVAARPGTESGWFEEMNHILVNAPDERIANLGTYAEPTLPLAKGLAGAIADFASRR